jgi:eukaryotic-like serine/threonine-protein kinase
VADALHHAHSFGIVHRDVKPANLMLLPGGAPKLLDFGIAKIAEAPGHWSLPGHVVGTPLYMSPEQALGESVDARSDIFALGAVLYFLLTGHPPFAAATIPHILLRVLHEDPLPVSLLVGGLPEDVEYVVARATAKSPQHRYESAGAMGQDIGDVLAGRRPRHRGAWTPPRAHDTLPSMPLEGDAALAELEAGLRGPVAIPPAAALSLGTSLGLTMDAEGSRDRRWRRSGLRAAALVLATAAALRLTAGRIGEPLEPRSMESAPASPLPADVALTVTPEPGPMTPVLPTPAPEGRVRWPLPRRAPEVPPPGPTSPSRSSIR